MNAADKIRVEDDLPESVSVRVALPADAEALAAAPIPPTHFVAAHAIRASVERAAFLRPGAQP